MEKKKENKVGSFVAFVLTFVIVKFLLDGLFLYFFDRIPSQMISEWISKIF